jgi:hypothetical protein
VKAGYNPTQAQVQAAEDKLREEFNAHLIKLVKLYGFAEKYDMEDVMNRAIDTIQDGLVEGTSASC